MNVTKKCLSVLLLCQAFVLGVSAKLQVTKTTDGTLVLTLEHQGDLSAEFTYTGVYVQYTASDLLKPYLGVSKVKVVTKNGATMSVQDFDRLCGEDDPENNFPNVSSLDLENAELAVASSISKLHFMDKLKTVVLPRTLTTVPNMCFTGYNCKIEHVVIPDNPQRSVTVEAQPFGPTLKTIKLGEVKMGGNSSLNQYSFLDCKQLVSVEFGSGWKTIGVQAFAGCSALKSLTLSEGIEHIEQNAFEGTSIEAIRLPNSLRTIGPGTFKCEKLKTITIPAGVELIKAQAFQDCKMLTDVYVLGENTKAEDQAFDITAVSILNYSNPSKVSPVTRAHYKRGNGSPMVMLHFPQGAKDKYLNPASKTLGGTTETVQAENGAYWPTKEDGKYTVCSGDYAGWHNFVLTSAYNPDEEVWEDGVRVKNKWYSMCFPFDMSEQQLKSAYGPEVRVMEFSMVKSGWDSPKHLRKKITLYFLKPATETKAHHPYMIHPATRGGTSTNMKNIVVGIKKQPEAAASLKKVTITEDGINYTFVGNYQRNRHLEKYSYYYYSGDDESVYKNGFYWWTKVNAGTWTPYMACVLASDDTGAGAKAETVFFSVDEEGTTTGINAVKERSETAEGKWNGLVFNLNGQAVGTYGDLEKLPKGIYLVNGKKRVVK